MIMEKTIRVLQIVPTMRSAGIENFVMNIYRNIDTSKVQFDFLVHSKKREVFDDEIERRGGKIYRLTYKDDKNVFKYIKDLNNFFKTHNEYKIVHGEMQSMMPLYLYIAKKYDVPIRIAHAHNSDYEKTIKGFILHLFSRYSKRYATNLWACSKTAGKYLFKNNSFEIIHNAINVEKYAFNEDIRNKMRKQKKFENKYVIGHIGRFDLQKNHDFLIDIFYEFQKIEKDAVLLCIGTGNREDIIKEKVKKLGIESKVIFEGVVTNSYDYYQIMDAFLLPSIYEGLPLVGVEAQISGLVCFFSDTITNELKLSDNVFFINLKDSPKKWAELINGNRINNRETHYIKDYDLKEESRIIESKYTNMIKELK